MKFLNKITFLTILFCLACLFVVNAEEESTGAAKRPSILLRRPNPQRAGGPLGNKAGAASTTTSTTQASPSKSNDDYNENEDYDQNENTDNNGGSDKGNDNENAAPLTTSTTTEPPKKIGPIIRPFRSNDDFLTALKRRQQNSKKGATHKVVEKPIVKTSEQEEDQDEPAPAANPVSKTPDRNARRNKFSAPKKTNTNAADSEDGNNEQQQPTNPAVKRPAGRFNLKKI